MPVIGHRLCYLLRPMALVLLAEFTQEGGGYFSKLVIGANEPSNSLTTNIYPFTSSFSPCAQQIAVFSFCEYVCALCRLFRALIFLWSNGDLYFCSLWYYHCRKEGLLWVWLSLMFLVIP